jgi:hypothetical protein
MAVVEEAAPVVVRPVLAAHAAVHVKATSAVAVAVAATMRADKVSRAAAIALPDQTTHQAVRSRIR